jgi:hypothetical protein
MTLNLRSKVDCFFHSVKLRNEVCSSSGFVLPNDNPVKGGSPLLNDNPVTGGGKLPNDNPGAGVFKPNPKTESVVLTCCGDDRLATTILRGDVLYDEIGAVSFSTELLSLPKQKPRGVSEVL